MEGVADPVVGCRRWVNGQTAQIESLKSLADGAGHTLVLVTSWTLDRALILNLFGCAL
jgi:hypothetical protein